MKILMISSVYYPDILGGGEFYTKQAVEVLSKYHDVSVLCCGDGTTEEINGVKIYRIIKEPYNIYKSIIDRKKHTTSKSSLLKMKKTDYFFDKKTYEFYLDFFLEEKFDVIHSNTPMANMGRYNIWKAAKDSGSVVSHVFHCPALVPDSHGNFTDKFLIKMNTRALKNVDHFVGVSQYILNYNSILDPRIKSGTVIYNSIDIEVDEGNAKEKKENIIIYAGILKTDKGIQTLLNAYKLFDNHPRLVFVGNGELENEIKRNGHTIIPWIKQEDLFSLIQKSKVLVLPSEWPEAFGRVVVEAALNGTIPVASSVGGIPEVLGSFPMLMFEEKNMNDLANKVNYVLSLSDIDYNSLLSNMQSDFERFKGNIFADKWNKFMEEIKNERL